MHQHGDPIWLWKTFECFENLSVRLFLNRVKHKWGLCSKYLEKALLYNLCFSNNKRIKTDMQKKNKEQQKKRESANMHKLLCWHQLVRHSPSRGRLHGSEWQDKSFSELRYEAWWQHGSLLPWFISFNQRWREAFTRFSVFLYKDQADISFLNIGESS